MLRRISLSHDVDGVLDDHGADQEVALWRRAVVNTDQFCRGGEVHGSSESGSVVSDGVPHDQREHEREGDEEEGDEVFHGGQDDMGSVTGGSSSEGDSE